MEPRASSPDRRLRTIAKLSKAGIPVSVMVAPVIPGLNDQELEMILERAASAGAKVASYILLRLPLEVSDLFREWIERAQPGHASKVLHRLTDMRGGKLNSSTFGERMVGTGPEAQLLKQRFETACRHFGLATSPPKLDCSAFIRPTSRDISNDGAQLALF